MLLKARAGAEKTNSEMIRTITERNQGLSGGPRFLSVSCIPPRFWAKRATPFP